VRTGAWRDASLGASVAVAALAVSTPLDQLADASFAWHMVQHLILLFCAPLLLLAGRPFRPFAAVAGKRLTARTVRALAPLQALASPPVAFAAFVGCLWATHFSPLYEAALDSAALHAAEHALYFAAGVAFWLPVLAPPPLRPQPYLVRLFYLLIALPQGALLGLVIDSARAPLYAHYARAMPFGAALADQQAAAAVMWIAGGAVVFAAMLATLGAWAYRESAAEHYVPSRGAAGSLLAVLLWLALCAAARAGGAGAGKELYQTYCASCHGANVAGTANAPSLVGRSAADIHFMLDTGRMPASLPYVNEIHRRPRFTSEQMASIVAYVERFSLHPDTALPVIMRGNVQRGRALFEEHCAVCHGAAGDGASVGADNVAPALHEATMLQVGEAIRAGPGVMPRFGPDVVSNQDLDDIAHYVNWLQTRAAGSPQNRGGFTLAHVGPTAEGFVAWFFGIGILVLAIRGIAAVHADGGGNSG
jgi:ubiquinol-cytochrome c reductase cytochrome c subunit